MASLFGIDLSWFTTEQAKRCALAALAGYTCAKIVRFYVRPGHDPPKKPGAFFLAYASRQTYPQFADMSVDPFFFNVTEPWVKKIEARWTDIRDELVNYLDTHDGKLTPFGHTDRMSSAQCWKILSLKLWNVPDPRAQTHFPKTLEIMESSIPDGRLVGMTFSQLEPHSDIAPHIGDTNANYRCHLGLIVPKPYPICALQVGTEAHGWEEGKIMAFNDAHHHRAWNHSDSRRFILIFDVMRKEHAQHTHITCATVLAAFITHRLANAYPWIKKSVHVEIMLHAVVRSLLTFPLTLGIGATTVHNILKGTA